MLQIDKIFTDVSKGEVAKQKDLKNVFGAKLSEDEIIMEILNKGEFQQSDKEREGQFENLRLDIANIIVKMTENTKDGNQFPVSMILKAMEECHCKINPQKTAKPQAIGFINELKKVLPIERTKMRLRITCGQGAEQAEELRKWFSDNHKDQHVVHSEKPEDSAVVLEVSIEPALYRALSDLTKQNKETFTNL